jgi:hypothetical protein
MLDIDLISEPPPDVCIKCGNMCGQKGQEAILVLVLGDELPVVGPAGSFEEVSASSCSPHLRFVSNTLFHLGGSHQFSSVFFVFSFEPAHCLHIFHGAWNLVPTLNDTT